MSPTAIAFHPGAAETAPVPSWVRNLFTATVFPAKTGCRIWRHFHKSRSPKVVIGVRALKAAAALVCPVPPCAIVAVPEISVKAGSVAASTPDVESAFNHLLVVAAID